MKRILLLISLILSMQSAHAIMMTGDGIDTGHGFISWDSLITTQKRLAALEGQVKLLRNALIIGSFAVAGTIAYIHWTKAKKETKAEQATAPKKNDQRCEQENQKTEA